MTTTESRRITGIVRLTLAGACLVGLVARYFWAIGAPTGTAWNYVSYFTTQSNIGFAIIGVVAGVVALKTTSDPRWLTVTRAAVLSCSVSSGVVFAFLVQQAGQRGIPIYVPWSDQLLHFLLPPLALLEWYLAPGRGRATFKTIGIILGYTVVWGILTLIRGAQVGWYPYYFLDPAQVPSFAAFVLYCAGVMAAIAAISAVVILISRLRMPWRHRAKLTE